MSVRIAIFLTLACATLVGCKIAENDKVGLNLPSSYSAFQAQPNLPIEDPSCIGVQSMSQFDPEPLYDFSFSGDGKFTRMGLEQCIHHALQNSPVIRELGGLILRTPAAVSTVHDTAIAYSDPRFGEEAALSAFDAQFTSQFLYQNNDRIFNNTFVGNSGLFRQNLANAQAGVRKIAATGAEFQFNHVIDYDYNNSPSNQFNTGGSTKSGAFDAYFEGRIRQPLLQGAGVNFNRIAGPNNLPGVNNGILIARANTDITLAQFETKIRDLISDVENAYWDLYFAYRNLEARIEARENAYATWQFEENSENSDVVAKAQAKEQYYRFATDVEDAIIGRLNDGTRTNNGSASGTFRRTGGVRTAERRLRMIMGLQLNDATLVVPSESPTSANTAFDWETSKSEALELRPELRRQRWQYRKRQWELLASKNHLLPRVDILGAYRLRGFGDDLFGDTGYNTSALGSSAYGTMATGDLQEWEFGLDVSLPVGYRREHSAVRAAELLVARERAILAEQERQVVFGLSNAMGELVRSAKVRDTSQQRYKAALAQFEAVKLKREEQDISMDVVREAQRLVIDSKLQYYQSEVEYMLAIKAIHFEKGTLAKYHNVTMSESMSDGTSGAVQLAGSRSGKTQLAAKTKNNKTNRTAAKTRTAQSNNNILRGLFSGRSGNAASQNGAKTNSTTVAQSKSGGSGTSSNGLNSNLSDTASKSAQPAAKTASASSSRSSRNRTGSGNKTTMSDTPARGPVVRATGSGVAGSSNAQSYKVGTPKMANAKSATSSQPGRAAKTNNKAGTQSAATKRLSLADLFRRNTGKAATQAATSAKPAKVNLTDSKTTASQSNSTGKSKPVTMSLSSKSAPAATRKPNPPKWRFPWNRKTVAKQPGKPTLAKTSSSVNASSSRQTRTPTGYKAPVQKTANGIQDYQFYPGATSRR